MTSSPYSVSRKQKWAVTPGPATCLLIGVLASYPPHSVAQTIATPLGPGPHSVTTTNMEVAPEYADIGNDAMHDILLGRARPESGGPRFLTEILRYPDSAWITQVTVPDNQDVYGNASGETLSIPVFVSFPSAEQPQPRRYTFPYHDGEFGRFGNMLGSGEEPRFADPTERYPLIIIAHGAESHGIYDVAHAENLASHGYIVAVITFGDDRTSDRKGLNLHLGFLRPLMTRAVVDSLLESETFGPHIDADNIGITGHSFGGFTALAVAGAPYLANEASVSDERIRAGVVAAPWVGGHYDGEDLYAFGPGNIELSRVDIPVICLFGTADEATRASFILPAMAELSGPTYVVELVDQPHIFEPGSWQDRDNWELLFFAAWLKRDAAALELLRTAQSMQGGNEDVQRFEYQSKATGN